VDWALNHWWQLTLIAVGVLLLVSSIVIAVKVYALTVKAAWTQDVMDDVCLSHDSIATALLKLEQTIDVIGVTNLPRDGFPQQMEACWEDVGAKGRFLTDLGGMSIKMRQQMLSEFYAALDKPMPCTPAAGSFNDVMNDLDAWLTKQTEDKDDELVIVKRKVGETPEN